MDKAAIASGECRPMQLSSNCFSFDNNFEGRLQFQGVAYNAAFFSNNSSY